MKQASHCALLNLINHKICPFITENMLWKKFAYFTLQQFHAWLSRRKHIWTLPMLTWTHIYCFPFASNIYWLPFLRILISQNDYLHQITLISMHFYISSVATCVHSLHERIFEHNCLQITVSKSARRSNSVEPLNFSLGHNACFGSCQPFKSSLISYKSSIFFFFFILAAKLQHDSVKLLPLCKGEWV